MSNRVLGRITGLSPSQRLLGVAAVTLLCIVLFMSLNLPALPGYALQRRGEMIASMLLVGFASGISTVLFQTLTHNRILTPAVMGFEAMFVLIQTSLLFFLGTQLLQSIDPMLRFVAESLVMVLFSFTLYRWLFAGSSGSLHVMLLVGIIFGVLFTSLSVLMQRLLLPSEFNALQGRLFARLSRSDPELIALGGAIVAGVCILLWRMRHVFDVLALGRNPAISLGIDYRRQVTLILVLVSVLVSVSTALIGPLTFLGFMAATLAYQIAGSGRHLYVLPMSFLLAVLFLVGGQLILEHVLAMSGALTIVIEFIGGLLFILLLLKKGSL